MFNLDIAIFDFFYNICKHFGSCFLLGAFEGFVMLSGIITATVLSAFNPKPRKAR